MCGTPWTSLERHPGGNLICKSGVRGEILVGALWKRRRHKGSIKKQKAIEEAEGRLLCLLEPPEQPSVAPRPPHPYPVSLHCPCPDLRESGFP